MPTRYQHYKGGIYEFITWAYDADTKEQKAVFRNEQTEVTWIRPAIEFNGNVEVDGKIVPRFKLL